MMNSTFKAPSPLTVDMVIDLASSMPGVHDGSLRRFSPEEEHHSFILATDRDLQANVNEDLWVKAWLSSMARCVKLESQEKIFWKAGEAREKIGEKFDCLYYSTVPRFCFSRFAMFKFELC